MHEISGIRSYIHVQFGAWQIEIMILSQVILIPVFFPQYTMELLFFLVIIGPTYYDTVICILKYECFVFFTNLHLLLSF